MPGCVVVAVYKPRPGKEAEFEACCWYETPANVPDLQRMFVSLAPLD
jgi:hypothetical protein